MGPAPSSSSSSIFPKLLAQSSSVCLPFLPSLFWFPHLLPAILPPLLPSWLLCVESFLPAQVLEVSPVFCPSSSCQSVRHQSLAETLQQVPGSPVPKSPPPWKAPRPDSSSDPPSALLTFN